jgi:hypothetical protein
MCDPITLGVTSALMSVAQAGAGFAGAQAQADAQNEAYAANALSAQAAARGQFEDLNLRRNQTKLGADQNLFDKSIEALQKRSTAVTAAGESGVTGLSVDALVGSLFAQEGRNADRIGGQYAADVANIETQMRDASANAQRRINSMQQAADPSPLPFIIQGASGAVNAYSKMTIPGTGTR